MSAPLVYIDGFDHQDLTRYPSYVGTPTFVAGRFGGYALRCDSAGENVRMDFLQGSTESSLGMSLYIDSVSGNVYSMTFRDTGGSTLVALYYATSVWSCVSYANGTSAGSAPMTIGPVLDTWHTFEMIFRYSSTASGLIQFYLDGTLAYEKTGGNTRTDAVTGVPGRVVLSGESTLAAQYDDLWVESGAGANRRGNRRVALLTPTSDSTTQWDTTTGANHYSVLADVNTATYVATPALTGEVDSFGFSDLGSEVTAVEGVCVSASARKTDIGTAKLALQRGGTTGTTQTVTSMVGSGIQQVHETFETAGDATAWTPAKVNASTFGIVAAS